MHLHFFFGLFCANYSILSVIRIELFSKQKTVFTQG